MLERDGRRFTIRPEKIVILVEGEQPAGGDDAEAGAVSAVVYVGSVTRFVVELDAGGTLTAVRQNVGSSTVGSIEEGQRVLLAWRPENTFTIEALKSGGGQMRRIGKRHAVARRCAHRARRRRGAGRPHGGDRRQEGGGTLKMIGWDGYLDQKWVNPFQKQSGCKVKAKIATTSDEMVALMRSGGGGQYDMVSASGDASLRLIYGGDVQPVDVSKVPEWKQFYKPFQSPANNTVDGKHYGISLQFGPNTLLWRTDKVKPAPKSWAAIYSSKYKGRITIPDNAIQIADAALYLMKTQPALGIKDPYELNKKQFDATVNLLKKQRPLIKKYWVGSPDNAELIESGDAWIGPTWPITTGSLQGAQGARRRDDPEGGRDELARHVDALQEVEERRLRLQVVPVHLGRRGCRRSRAPPGARRR